MTFFIPLMTCLINPSLHSQHGDTPLHILARSIPLTPKEQELYSQVLNIVANPPETPKISSFFNQFSLNKHQKQTPLHVLVSQAIRKPELVTKWIQLGGNPELTTKYDILQC
jgi:hypothetical protein